MARWGEGDPRWICEQRPDAVNPSNWHWVEKNATPWSRERLTELLTKKSFGEGPLKVDLLDFKKLEGDATANNRKSKLIFLYEWNVEISFLGTVADSEIEYKGIVEIPNFSDENDAHEIEISVQIDERGPHEQQIRELIHKKGLEFIRSQIAIYLKELKEEYSKDLILPTNNDKPQIVVKSKTMMDKKPFQNIVPEKNVNARPDQQSYTPSGSVSATKSLELTQSFKVPPERLYEILTKPEFVKIWAGGSSTINSSPGGEFSLIGGAFSGSIISMTENKEIAEMFRLRQFPAGHFAKIIFKLIDKGDCTDLKIEAEGVPELSYTECSEGLHRYFLQGIGNAFSIGLKII